MVNQKRARASSSPSVRTLPFFVYQIEIEFSMQTPNYKELLDAGVHFGHLRRKWNPKMLPYIFMQRKGIHLIDVNRTIECMERTGQIMYQMAKSGKKIMFVATKKQARDIVQQAAESVNMPFVANRWLGGMMTNFATIRKSIKNMQHIERSLQDGTLSSVTKKERLMLSRKRDNLQKVFGGIAQLNRLPHAIFVVDIVHEHIAISEAKKLGIKTFAIVDTNSDPTKVDYPIPANDDASKSVAIITNYLTACIKKGLEERTNKKAEQDAEATA
jgi:small subunit ribosomal protein S2